LKSGVFQDTLTTRPPPPTSQTFEAIAGNIVYSVLYEDSVPIQSQGEIFTLFKMFSVRFIYVEHEIYDADYEKRTEDF
jgi:hypothetical protein